MTHGREVVEPPPDAWQPRQGLGVVLAGGASRRFGQDKALFPLAGRPMASWALEAVGVHAHAVGVIANSPVVGRALGVRWRSDAVPGLGPLGGLLTALEWAAEEGRDAILLLACDLPLVTPSLLARILHAWVPGSTAVVPGSSGPLGFEPLCGAYAVSTLSVARERAAAEDRSMEGFLKEVEGAVVPAHQLGSATELDLAFKNVNTESDARWAERALRERAAVFGGVSGSRGGDAISKEEEP